ncbi:inclusion body family protein [Streptomyces roseochromogenus]|uniref:Inclusion body protein n=1 Tax=Streptomyces roseochromogenus subsp. oscitans DS 12.976 TaxID=1352936 RepID=V6JI84_STRRC|nr:inclusion body family protein [Streptomyces roseochromogenus]EST18846.1 hypothetical protein M878_43820 [Streptomyces roseochromogenus subsp. oscitans DS 12.976]
MTAEANEEALPAQASKIINVLISYDAFTIKERYPNPSQDPNNPTHVGHDLIYMTTRQDSIIGMPGAELNIAASPGDLIRWRETTLSLNFDYSALLYRYVSADQHLISPPQVRRIDARLPLPIPNSHEFETQDIEQHYWSTEVLKLGTVTYRFFFQLLDGKNRLGFFQWDPFITIKPR